MTTAKYQAYPEYTDTGIDWLGFAPKRWLTIPVGRLFTRIKRTGHIDQELLSVYRDYGVIPKSSRDDNNNKPSEDLSPYQLVKKNDLVMNKMKTWQGSLAISEFEGIVSPAYFVYQPLEKLFEFAHPKYVHYLLRNPMFIAQYLRRSKGIRVNQWDLDPSEFQRVELLLPTKNEQLNIFSFLDHETSKIDTLIEKQQKLIKLLKEKRQAVISHLVIKGLNPDVPLHDSGVELLGEVPRHWSVSQVGHCAFVTKLTGFEYTNLWKIKEEGEVIALRGFNVKERWLDLNDVERISYELSRTLTRSKLAKGDIVFPCTGTIGNAAIIEEDNKFHINQNIAKISFDNSVSPRFSAYWLTSSFVRTNIDRNNTSGMQPVVLIGDIRKLPIPRFCYQEQEAIADFLDTVVDSFNVLISKAESAIEFSKERRTALIFEAVTGKIDVRNWQAPKSPTSNSSEATA